MKTLLHANPAGFIDFYNNLKINDKIWFIDSFDDYKIEEGFITNKNLPIATMENYKNSRVDVFIPKEHHSYERSIYLDKNNLYLSDFEANYELLKEKIPIQKIEKKSLKDSIKDNSGLFFELSLVLIFGIGLYFFINELISIYIHY